MQYNFNWMSRNATFLFRIPWIAVELKFSPELDYGTIHLYIYPRDEILSE